MVLILVILVFIVDGSRVRVEFVFYVCFPCPSCFDLFVFATGLVVVFLRRFAQRYLTYFLVHLRSFVILFFFFLVHFLMSTS